MSEMENEKLRECPPLGHPQRKAWKDSIRYFKLKKEKPWKIVYHNIVKRINNDLGYKGLILGINEEDLRKIWFRDKAYLLIRPSIDRKNNKEGYIRSNCQFIELSINSVKDKKGKKNGR